MNTTITLVSFMIIFIILYYQHNQINRGKEEQKGGQVQQSTTETNYSVSPTTTEEPRAKYFRQIQQVTPYDNEVSLQNPPITIDHGVYQTPEEKGRDEPNLPQPENAEDTLPPADFQSDTTNISQFYNNNPELFHREFTGYVPDPSSWEKAGQELFSKRLNEAQTSSAPAEPYLDPDTEAITVPGEFVEKNCG